MVAKSVLDPLPGIIVPKWSTAVLAMEPEVSRIRLTPSWPNGFNTGASSNICCANPNTPGVPPLAAIGAFAGAITAALGAPFGFQAITAVHTGVLYLLITETGIENFFWIVIVLSELLFFGVYYI